MLARNSRYNKLNYKRKTPLKIVKKGKPISKTKNEIDENKLGNIFIEYENYSSEEEFNNFEEFECDSFFLVKYNNPK